VSRLSGQCEILNISQHYRFPWPVTGIALLFSFIVLLNILKHSNTCSLFVEGIAKHLETLKRVFAICQSISREHFIYCFIITLLSWPRGSADTYEMDTAQSNEPIASRLSSFTSKTNPEGLYNDTRSDAKDGPSALDPPYCFTTAQSFNDLPSI
jgi:hypothetical protein